MARYVPRPAPFITPQMTGGAMASLLTSIAEGIVSGAAGEFNAATSTRPSRPGGWVFNEVYRTEVQGGGLPRVAALAGVSGPYVLSIEFGSHSGAGRGTRGGWSAGRHILGGRV